MSVTALHPPLEFTVSQRYSHRHHKLTPQTLTVLLYPTRAAMHVALESRYRSIGNITDVRGGGALEGCWRPGKGGSAGTLYLHREYINSPHVSHEALHAALTVYRRAKGGEANLGYACQVTKEELLCDIHQDLFSQIMWALEERAVDVPSCCPECWAA